jgi:hypothetical protein
MTKYAKYGQVGLSTTLETAEETTILKPTNNTQIPTTLQARRFREKTSDPNSNLRQETPSFALRYSTVSHK